MSGHVITANLQKDPRQLYGSVPGTLVFGVDGATFVPSVSEDGTLSWQNNRGLPNPMPVNIRGPQGDKGPKPVKGVDYYTDEEKAEIVDEVVKTVGDSVGVQFETDNTLKLENGILSVNTVDQVIEDDFRPVTSGAVYQEFSKAVALLKTI